MVVTMPNRSHNVPLPFAAPTTEALREAVAQIIRDLTAQHGITDLELAGQLNVHANTVAAWRNKKNDMGALMIATIGDKYGPESVAPFNALYGATAHGIAAQDAAPLRELAEALAAPTQSASPKARFDSLPTLREASEALNGYILSLERWRNAA
jgi:transcriptional regulator with XRE-family HTH domain